MEAKVETQAAKGEKADGLGRRSSRERLVSVETANTAVDVGCSTRTL
jgi:hypothetical protein